MTVVAGSGDYDSVDEDDVVHERIQSAMTPEEAARDSRRMPRRIGGLAGSGARVAGIGLRLLAQRARQIADAGLDRLRERHRRRRERGRRGRAPLPSLFDLHPEARNQMRREIGLRSIPLVDIVGTAVAGPAQRGSDFQPLPAFRSANWKARWLRINRAVDELAILPPIDVVRLDDDYWVEDGHNRVAAALANGQIEIDASVTELRLPNARGHESPTALAPLLETARELRAAGEGRFSALAASHLATSADGADAGHAHVEEWLGGDDDVAADVVSTTNETADGGPVGRMAAPAPATDRTVRPLTGSDASDPDGNDQPAEHHEGTDRLEAS